MRTLKIVLFFSAVMMSCSKEPAPLNYGKDSCEHCKMTMMDVRYGAEIVTSKGKIFKFDATECMINFIKENTAIINTQKDNFLTVNIASPGTLTDARTAVFLNDKAFRSPMGGNLASFNTRQLAENNLQSPDGTILTWEQLINKR